MKTMHALGFTERTAMKVANQSAKIANASGRAPPSMDGKARSGMTSSQTR